MTKEERIAKMQDRQNYESSNGGRKLAYRMPKDIKVYKVKEGENRIDIIPYVIKNPNNPAVLFNGFKVGDLDYYQQLEVHRRIGTSYNDYLCAKRMFGQRCAICDAQKQAYDAGDAETGKSLYPQTRVVYNIIDLNDPDSGIQLFEISYAWFEKQLRELAAMKSKKGQPIIFGDWEIGKTIVFYGSKGQYGKGDYFEPKNYSFEEREKPYTEEIVKRAHPLDEYFVMPDYDVVEADYLQAPLASRVDHEETLDEKKFMEANNVIEDDLIPPAPENFKGDELPEEPKTENRRERRKPEPAGFVCPFGHKAGDDFDKHEDCTKCKDSDYNQCGDMFDKMSK